MRERELWCSPAAAADTPQLRPVLSRMPCSHTTGAIRFYINSLEPRVGVYAAADSRGRHVSGYTVHCTPRCQGCINTLPSLPLPPRWLLSYLTVSHYRTVGRGWGSQENEPDPVLSPTALPSPTPIALGPPGSLSSQVPGSAGMYATERRTGFTPGVRHTIGPVYRCTGVMHRHIDTEYAYRHGNVCEVLRCTD